MDPTKLMYTVLAEKATKEEIRELNEWISLSEENREEFQDIKLLYEASVKVEVNENDQCYDGLRKVKQTIHKRSENRKKKKVVLFCVMVFLLLSIFFFFLTYKAGKTKRLLKFDNVSMESVINVLEREYQIQIASPKSIQSCKFTGTFYKASASEVVKVIALNFNLEYEVVGDHEFRLKGEGC